MCNQAPLVPRNESTCTKKAPGTQVKQPDKNTFSFKTLNFFPSDKIENQTKELYLVNSCIIYFSH